MTDAKQKTVAPYGFWESPISTDLLLSKSTGLSEVFVPSGSDDSVAWIESRPSEAGRSAFMHLSSLSSPASSATDLTSGKYNARSGVHEYGGGSACALPDGGFLFTDYSSFNVLSVQPGSEPKVITEENKAIRYADFGAHPKEERWVLAIEEDHAEDTPSTVVNSVVLLDLSTTPAKVHTLLKGKKADEESEEGPGKRDFFTFPRFSPNGQYVCWVSWNHPSMPWWDTQLWVAKLDLSSPASPRLVSPTRITVPTSDATKQQVMQEPVWAIPANPADDAAKLFFACNATGYLNLYSTSISSTTEGLKAAQSEPVLPEPVKHDFVGPAWGCNSSNYIPLSPDLLVCSYSVGAKDCLGLINLRRPRLIPLQSDFVSVSQLRRLSNTSFVLLASTPTEPTALIRISLLNLASQSYRLLPTNITTIKRSSTLISDGLIDKAYLSEAKELDFPTTLPNGTKAVAHAVLWEPKSKDYVGEKGTSPPCVFNIHGGPSSSAGMGFNLQTAFWTSRGFMVCSVNYGGTTGYGREYLERLTGEWGVTDVLDTIAAAKFLGSKASLDPRPFGDLTEAEQNKVRNELKKGGEEGAVEVEEKNGGVKVVLRNTTPAWSWADVVLAGASVAAAYFGAKYLPRYAHCIPPSIRPGAAVLKSTIAALGMLPYALSKAGRVASESVSLLPGIGVQLSTTRSLTLPFSRTPILTRTSARLIPEDRVLDIYVAEGYRFFSIIDYLALTTTSGGSASIQRLFPNLLPRLPTTQRIYRALSPHLPTNIPSKPPTKTRTRSSLADPSKMLISGGSAGGYTVLACLCFHPDTFAGGVSRYGISDLKLLAEESHKFESRYPFQLIGGTPQSKPEVYRERSPIYAASKIKAPVLLLQGSVDRVVPQSQADEFVKELKKGGGKEGRDWRYKVYEGEGHGFRKGENVKDALEEELRWWRERCLTK